MTTSPVEPAITYRPAQPYVGVRRVVTMRSINEIADQIPVVLGWLSGRGVAPAGAPFLRFNLIDMDRELEIEAGVPVGAPVAGDEPVFAGTLPAGQYATVTHVGHFDELIDATAELLTWADRHGLTWDVADTEAGQRWGCRLEIYHTDPAVEPDPTRWETELAFRLAG